MKKIILPFLFLTYNFLFANEIKLDITNYTLTGNIKIDIPKNNNFAIRGTYLYNDKSNKYDYYSMGIQAQGLNNLDNGNSKLLIFLDFTHTKNNSAIPLGIGIESDYLGKFQYPLFVNADIAYAPAVLSFDKANRFLKVKGEIGVQPIQNAKLFIGYRNISFNKNYQSVIYLGVGFNF